MRNKIEQQLNKTRGWWDSVEGTNTTKSMDVGKNYIYNGLKKIDFIAVTAIEREAGFQERIFRHWNNIKNESYKGTLMRRTTNAF